MRLTFKLAAVWIALMMLVLSFTSWMHARRLVRLSEREAVDDQQILARALAPAVAEIWQTSGQARAQEYVKGADARRQHTIISMVPSAADALSEAKTTLTDRSIVTTVPLPVPGASWALHVERDTTVLRDSVRMILLRNGILFALLVLGVGALATALGHLLVGRRTAALQERIMALSRGERDVVEPAGLDELDELSRSFNALSTALLDAQEQVKAERKRRERALSQLRHADRLAAVGQIGSSMAHEIATPLNVISGYAQMLPDLDDEGERAEVRDVIVGQTERIAAHLRALLDYSRKRAPQAQDITAEQSVAELRLMLAPWLDAEGVTLEVGPLTDHRFFADPHLVVEVLVNLVTNAVKFTPEGGVVRVDATHRADIPSPPAFRAGPHVVFGVQDHGPGMDQDTLSQLFEPFYTTTEAGEGTGLGLSICQDIMRDHEGYVQAQSQPGEGTTFFAAFPAADREAS